MVDGWATEGGEGEASAGSSPPPCPTAFKLDDALAFGDVFLGTGRGAAGPAGSRLAGRRRLPFRDVAPARVLEATSRDRKRFEREGSVRTRHVTRPDAVSL